MNGSETVVLVSFVGMACLAYFAMLHLLGTPNAPHAKLLRILHRTSGSLAVILYGAVIALTLLAASQRRIDLRGEAYAMVILTGLFVPLIVLKVVIVEKYPELRNRLFGIGTLILIVSVTFCLSSFFLAKDFGGYGKLSASSREELSLGRDLFAIKCAKCHRLERSLTASKSVEEWQKTVEAMREKDVTWISDTEARSILKFLIAIGAEPGDDKVSPK